MKKLMMFLVACTLFVCACDKEETKAGDTPSLVGEWSMMAGVDDVRMHLSLKADGKYVLTMPAWIEQRFGTYKVEGDVLTLKCTELVWVIGRDNGYVNVYDQYVDARPGSTHADPDFDDFAAGRPEEVNVSLKYAIIDGKLHVDGLFGLPMEEAWVIDEKFDARAECQKHWDIQHQY